MVRSPFESDPATALERDALLTGGYSEAAFWVVIALLTAAAGLARSQGLAPHTLWHDDVWVGAITRLPFWQAVTTPFQAPQGFLAGSWILSRLVGGKELALQVIPFSASLFAILTTGLLGRWATGSRAIGVLAVALAVLNPRMTHYAVFVKQYTSEYLLVALLLALAVRETRRERDGVPWTLMIVAVLACLVGFATVVVAVVVTSAVLVARAWRDRGRRRSAAALLGPVVGFNLAVLAYYGLVLAPRSNSGLERYWGRYFIPLDSVGAAMRHIEGVSLDALRGAFPDQLRWCIWLVPIGIAWMMWRRRSRALGLAVTGIMAALVGLNLLGKYPLGGGRTDVFLFPVVILAAVVGAHALSRSLPGARAVRIAAAVIVAGFTVLNAPGEPYFDLDLKDFVGTMDRRAKAAHGIVVYPAANTLMAFYTKAPVRLAPSTDNLPFFDFQRPRTLSLSKDSAVGRRQLADFLRQASYPKIWFFATRERGENEIEPLTEMIRSRGYEVSRRWDSRIRTQLILFER